MKSDKKSTPVFLKVLLSLFALLAVSSVGFFVVFGYGGGGGSSSGISCYYRMTVNGGNDVLESNDTYIDLDGCGATFIKVAETEGLEAINWDSYSFLEYSSHLTISLSSTPGEKNVSVRFYSSERNLMALITKTVTLEPLASAEVAPPPELSNESENENNNIVVNNLNPASSQTGSNMTSTNSATNNTSNTSQNLPASNTNVSGKASGTAGTTGTAGSGTTGNSSSVSEATKIAQIEPLITTVSFGNRSEEVKVIQKNLQDLGFFPEYVNVTGYFGEITNKAVTEYKDTEKMTVDELITKTKKGDRNSLVSRLQMELKKLGFFPASHDVTGYYWNVTAQSVENYQKNSVR